MDAATVRKHLAEITGQLARNEEEHEVLISLQRGYEGWLRLNPDAAPPAAPPATVPMFEEPKKRSVPRGTISLRRAVIQVLRDARGEPLHAKEILSRVLALGASTESKTPIGTVDLMCHSLKRSHPVEKVGPRTWRWAG